MERLWRRNWEFPINKELLIIATHESGLDQRLLESRDEAGMNSPLYSIAMGTAHHYPGTQVGYSVDVLAKQAQYEAVQNVARKGGCVVVGRCANYILRDHINLVRIFTLPKEMTVWRTSVRETMLIRKRLPEKCCGSIKSAVCITAVTPQQWENAASLIYASTLRKWELIAA